MSITVLLERDARGAALDALALTEGRIVFLQRSPYPCSERLTSALKDVELSPLFRSCLHRNYLVTVLEALFPGEHSRHYPLLAIEQPELGLPVAVHGELGELLLRRSEALGVRVIVSTHSDVLLLRLRALIAEGSAKPRDVEVYFFDEDKKRLREITLYDDGTPAWWPEGLFSEAALEYQRIRRALNRRNAVDKC